MNRVKITAIRQTVYTDLMEKYENPIEHACEVTELLCLQLEKLPLSAEHALEMVSFC